MISSLSRTNPEHTEQLSLTDMFTQASAAMLEQGVDPKDLDPAIAVLAMFNNKTVLNAAQQVSVAGTIRESLTDQLPTEQDEQLIKTARHISGVQYELGRPARRRNVVRGLAIAAITGGGLLTLIGSAKDDIRESLGHNDAVVAEGNRIMDNNTLVYDPSILKGDAGKDIPVVGPILGAIPGIPDYGSLKRPVTSYEERTITSERVTEAQGYESDDVANPVAPNLELTGQEYGQARQAAAALFDRLGPTFTIEDVLVAGSVSDDFGGKIGQPNPEQQKLADARAEVAARAFQDEAAARGIVLPKEPVKIGTEKVVMPELEAQIIQVLEQHKLDLPTAISRYNRGDVLPQDVRELLDSAIGGSNRGAAYEVSGTKQVTEQVAVTEWVEDTEDQIFKDIPGEGVFAFGALPGLIYGGLFGIMSSKARQTRRRARRIAKRAGLAL